MARPRPLAEGSRLDIGAPIIMPVISSLQALALTRDNTKSSTNSS
ncbi:MAG TPA: hypothetical protein VGR61_06240 [Candidatus Dormibacteraeota bacterium]|nr:hypothetical protein [Candidatus Dormibacteraeota bacterium]